MTFIVSVVRFVLLMSLVGQTYLRMNKYTVSLYVFRNISYISQRSTKEVQVNT